MGGVRDKDLGLAAIMREVKNAHGHHVAIGVLGEQAAEAVDGELNLAALATIHEFGAENAGASRTVTIPERSFLRDTVDDPVRGKHILEFAEKELARIVDSKGRHTAQAAFNRFGLYATNQVQRRIERRELLPNAPATIAKKGSDTPLIDDGHLKNAITHDVRKGPPK